MGKEEGGVHLNPVRRPDRVSRPASDRRTRVVSAAVRFVQIPPPHLYSLDEGDAAAAAGADCRDDARGAGILE